MGLIGRQGFGTADPAPNCKKPGLPWEQVTVHIILNFRKGMADFVSLEAGMYLLVFSNSKLGPPIFLFHHYDQQGK